MCEGFKMSGAGFYGLLGLVFVLFIVSVSVKLSKKGAYRLLFFNISVIAGYFLMLCISCGPNPRDVAVMKPMGDAINRYLTTQGKPSSLESIPDLPYKLKCGSPYSCRFEGKYKVEFRRWSPSIYSLNISQSEKYHTGILYNYRYTNKRFEQKETKYYSNKTTGICNPMRQ